MTFIRGYRAAYYVGSRSFSNSTRKYYQVLGIGSNATQDEIKKAFYTLSKKYHPDVAGQNKVASQKFIEIKEAYDILRDNQRRKDYDREESYNSTEQYSNQNQTWNWDPYPYTRKTRNEWRTSYTEDDFARIWKNMQGNPEFQKANREFWDEIRKKRNHDYEEYMHKRQQRAYESRPSDPISDINSNRLYSMIRMLLSNLLFIYAMCLMLSLLFRSSSSRNHQRDPVTEHIDEIIKRRFG